MPDPRVQVQEADCEFAGHQWADAGGDLLICLVCEAETWAREETAAYWAKYPREFADGATVEGAANQAQTPREERAACGRCGGQVVNPGRHGEGQCTDMREETP